MRYSQSLSSGPESNGGFAHFFTGSLASEFSHPYFGKFLAVLGRERFTFFCYRHKFSGLVRFRSANSRRTHLGSSCSGVSESHTRGTRPPEGHVVTVGDQCLEFRNSRYLGRTSCGETRKDEQYFHYEGISAVLSDCFMENGIGAELDGRTDVIAPALLNAIAGQADIGFVAGNAGNFVDVPFALLYRAVSHIALLKRLVRGVRPVPAGWHLVLSEYSIG